MAVWTYSRYENGHQRETPPEARRHDDDELDQGALEELAEACASDDHYNHDGWDGGNDERSIHLFRNGIHHSTYTATVDYQPVFTAQAAQGGEK